jgi:hypothetical protein
MRKSISVSAVAFALVTAQAASAQTFTTTPGVYKFSGNPFFGNGILIKKPNGPELLCSFSFDIINNGSITADNFILTGGFNGLCSTFIFHDPPYLVTVSGSSVSISGIYIDTYFPAGDCAGTLTATFSAGSSEELTFFNATVPEWDVGTGDCVINGAITWP